MRRIAIQPATSVLFFAIVLSAITTLELFLFFSFLEFIGVSAVGILGAILFIRILTKDFPYLYLRRWREKPPKWISFSKLEQELGEKITTAENEIVFCQHLLSFGTGVEENGTWIRFRFSNLVPGTNCFDIILVEATSQTEIRVIEMTVKQLGIDMPTFPWIKHTYLLTRENNSWHKKTTSQPEQGQVAEFVENTTFLSEYLSKVDYWR